MFDNLSTGQKVIAGILMLMLVTAVVSAAPPGIIVVLIIGLMSLMRRGREGERVRVVRPGRRIDDEELFNERTVRPERTTFSEHIHQNAIRAVRAAGHDPDDLPVLPVDLGVLVFFEDESPAVYRTFDVPDDADYVQPFIEMRVPVDATGKVRFELVDATDTPVFIHEDYHELRRGRNLISPAARLPVHDELELDDSWLLRVYADDVLLVEHAFDWEPLRDRGDKHIRKHIGEDGEISNELRAILTESRLQPLSLDDLLAEQEESAQQQN